MRLLHDVITYANVNNIPLAPTNVDQLKAFDRVSHDFLVKTLQCFGFGPDCAMDSGYLQFRIKLSKNKWLAYILYWIRAGSPTGLPTIYSPLCINKGKNGL